MPAVSRPQRAHVRSEGVPTADPHRYRPYSIRINPEKHLSSMQRKTGTAIVQELLARIELSFRAAGYLALREIRIHWEDGQAVLRGCVPSYFLKQKAQSVALDILGANDIRNELIVSKPPLSHQASTRIAAARP